MLKAIRNAGKIEIKGNVPKSKGYLDFKEFLNLLAEKLLKKSVDFMAVDPEYPIYNYSEKSFHTILTPSIYEVTKSFIVESPVNRYRKGKRNISRIDSHGWVDYWIEYKSIRIYLELKHGRLNVKSKNPRKYIQEELWYIMDDQLDKTEKEAKYDQDNWAGKKTVFRAGMLILPFYQRLAATNKKDALNKMVTQDEDFIDILDNIFDKLEPRPKWGSLLLMHSKFYENLVQDLKDGKFMFRPGFLILMNIKEIKKQQ